LHPLSRLGDQGWRQLRGCVPHSDNVAPSRAPFSVFFEVLKIQSPNHCYRSAFGFQLPDRIASVFLLSLFFGEQIDYLLSV
jgi:hypothetical protein